MRDKRKFYSQGNTFNLLILLPFYTALKIFNLNFLIFLISKTLKFLYPKFLKSVANEEQYESEV